MNLKLRVLETSQIQVIAEAARLEVQIRREQDFLRRHEYPPEEVTLRTQQLEAMHALSKCFENRINSF